MLALSVVFAVLAAFGFALSSSLQHEAADHTPTGRHSMVALLGHLMRRPAWIVGQVLALASFWLHALALHAGALIIVQPIVTSGIVMAVPIRAALARRLPSRREVGIVGLTAAGLALFLVSARPSEGKAPADHGQAVLLALVVAAGATLCVWLAGRARSKEHAATFFGIAAGLLFGLVAGMIKLAAEHYSAAQPHGLIEHLTALFVQWPALGVVVFGITGVSLNQRAYHAARLSASMPILNMVNVVVALGFGVIVFAERPVHTPIALAAQLLAAILVAIGLRELARSEPADEGWVTTPY